MKFSIYGAINKLDSNGNIADVVEWCGGDDTPQTVLKQVEHLNEYGTHWMFPHDTGLEYSDITVNVNGVTYVFRGESSLKKLRWVLRRI